MVTSPSPPKKNHCTAPETIPLIWGPRGPPNPPAFPEDMRPIRHDTRQYTYPKFSVPKIIHTSKVFKSEIVHTSADFRSENEPIICFGHELVRKNLQNSRSRPSPDMIPSAQIIIFAKTLICISSEMPGGSGEPKKDSNKV